MHVHTAMDSFLRFKNVYLFVREIRIHHRRLLAINVLNLSSVVVN